VTTSEIISLVIAAISAVFSLMLSAIVWLVRHAAESEKRAMQTGIDEAKGEAKRARDRLEEEIELRHRHDVALGQLEPALQRLEETDSEQGRQIADLRSRLDRGQRTLSQMRPVADPNPTSDPPPLPPMRPKLPSRGGFTR
jgi:septal ring factor EnvC (AmiA/AmiB activator)